MPKNIILCSDGTGNSGGKDRGTNVWKLYKALDLHHSKAQVSIHDDGVGTSDFMLLKMLGGGFGWGLKRNVKRLYKFLVLQYERGQSGAPGDDIFLFGFSRGAHTVRMVAGMVCRSGLVDRTQCGSERDLDACIDKAYDAYVKCFAKSKRLREPHSGSPGDQSQYFVPKKPPTQKEPPELTDYLPKKYVIRNIPIKFIGVWDTVDAVGVPVDELREGLNLLQRVAILDKTLHPLVRHGCHAVAIDDQRHTFHPVMWNEWTQLPGQTIEQVWFAGVHSNVGGGYPKDEMALVSLNWMMAKAKKQGVVFIDEFWEGYRREADVHSKLYDSRAGLAAYYRYMPRDIKKICREHGIRQAKIHVSVFDRIQRGSEGYAPFNLPDEVVMEKADATEDAGFDASLLKSDIVKRCKHKDRVKLIGKIWDLVWIKRWLYLLTLAATGSLLYVVYWLGSQPGPACSGEWCTVGWIFTALGALLPSSASGVLGALRSNPFWLFLFAATFGLLVFVTKRVDRRINEVGNAGWRYVFENHRQQAVVKFGPLESILLESAWWLRDCWLSRRLMPFLKARIMPWFSLFAVVALTVWLIWKACSVTAVTVAAIDPCAGGAPCAPTAAGADVFDTRSACFATNIYLEAGKRYRFNVEPLDAWVDGDIPAGPAGFASHAGPWWMALAVPFRRAWREPWFTLMGSTGCDGQKPFAIGAGFDNFQIENAGRLHLFVNDAVCSLCPGGVWHYYKNNRGTARVTVTPID
ncbi:MAG: DUF2235 domain-containing protein [Sulfuricaulis sp.]|nr:DUF2235 domain-containing protein [Sulfuricaulis sp.]